MELPFSAETIISALINTTALLPSAKGIHDMLVSHRDQAVALVPVIQHLDEAEPAFEAAKKAAPNLAAAIEKLAQISVSQQSHTPNLPPAAVAKAAENITRSIAGKSHMSPEVEAKWLSNASPVSDDSRSGSG